MHRWLPVALLISCAPKATPPASPVVPAPPSDPASAPVLQLPPPAHDADTVRQMHAWLQLAETARTQLTQGDLVGARASAAAMVASSSPEGIPDGWRPFAADLLAEATSLATSESLDAAGGQLAQMAMACGTCHAEAAVLEQVEIQVLPEEMDDHHARMENHQWASDWMWFGMVTANERAYRLGAMTFTSDNLPPVSAAVQGPEMTALLARVDGVGSVAAEATDEEARATAYGQLLASCAACHAMVAGE